MSWIKTKENESQLSNIKHMSVRQKYKNLKTHKTILIKNEILHKKTYNGVNPINAPFRGSRVVDYYF